jgi:hypothetical protein
MSQHHLTMGTVIRQMVAHRNFGLFTIVSALQVTSLN